MIDETIQEQAALYVLGLLDAEATRAFEARLRGDGELQALVATLQTGATAMAAYAPRREPPPEVFARIQAAIHADKVVPMPRAEPVSQPVSASAQAPRTRWLPWAIAALLALGCVGLNQERTRLKQEIVRLEERDSLAQMKIATLSSQVATAPQGTAVIAWDGEKQQGILDVRNLPLPAGDLDYQLWVIDPRYPEPVDAGVFHVQNGSVRLVFRPVQAISSPDKFAVSLERKGGSPRHSGPIVLLSQ